MSELRTTNARPLMLAGEPASAVLRHIEPLSTELISKLAQNPAFQSFGATTIREDLTAVTAHGLRLAIRTLDFRQLPSDRELDSIGKLTVKQARKGVPLSAILTLTAEGISAFRNLIVNRAVSDDAEDLKELNRLIFALAQRLHTFVSVSYLAVAPAIQQTDAETTHRLVTALLAGENPSQMALLAGIDLPSSFLVLRLFVMPPSNPGTRVGAHHRIQAHRNLSAAQGMLATHYGPALFDAPAPHHGLVLIAGDPEWQSLRGVIKQIETELRIDIIAVGEQAELDQVSAAAVTTREIARLVNRLGLPHALYRMEDVALEYQLTRPGPARESLTRLLAPLDNFPELLQTLSIHLAHDQNRQRTASALGLHTNTVDNRIKRIAQLTGLDPTLPSGLLKLRAAMIALADTRNDRDKRPEHV